MRFYMDLLLEKILFAHLFFTSTSIPGVFSRKIK